MLNLFFINNKTTGDGELPENARSFAKKLDDGKALPNLHYTLLGLGSTDYSSYCGGPKTLLESLKKSGAKAFDDVTYADDATDMDDVVEMWVEGLWEKVKRACDALAEEEISKKLLSTTLEDDKENKVFLLVNFKSILQVGI